MPTQLITYDLRQPGRDYSKLHDAIKALGSTWWHCLDSIWLVKTAHDVPAIRDHLKQFIDANDDLVVLGLNGNWATVGLTDDCNKWLKDNLAP